MSPIFARPNRRWILFVCGVSLVVGYVFGNWYMKTGGGLGWRASQFFFNYQDLGFVKRALIGSLLHPFPVLQTRGALFAISWAFLLVFVGLFTGLFARKCRTLSASEWTRLLLLCAASPAFFLRLGFDFGRFDVLGLIAVLLAFSAIERGQPLVAGGVSALTLLAHEAYLLINLPLVAAFYWSIHGRPDRRNLRGYAGLLLPPLIVFALLTLYGRYEPGLKPLAAYFASRPAYLAACGGEVNLDAIEVLTRTYGETFAYTCRLFWEKKALLHLPIIAAWGTLMTFFLTSFYRSNGLRRDVLFYAAFSPLLLCAIASDYYRWVALAAINMFLVTILHLGRAAQTGASLIIPAGPATWFLLATSLLGPISNTKSFPLVFLILDWLFPGKIVW